MQKPVYKNEGPLFIIALIISLLVWAGLIAMTKGAILFIIPVFFIAYLFVQSGFISYLKGTGALVSSRQFPDIEAKVKSCADKVGLKNVPDVYILHGNGVFNAFATRFLRKDYIILLSDVLDALDENPEVIDFYIGHEMGHIDRKHLLWEPLLSFGLILPLLGAGYSRAREYTCDLYGAACCSPEAAQKGLALLAVGAKRYKSINVQEYTGQVEGTSGFWMSFHELIASYPWLVKRFASIAPDRAERKVPSRNVLAYIPAIFVPRLSVMSIIVIYILIICLSGSMLTPLLLKGVKDAEQEAGVLTGEAIPEDAVAADEAYQEPDYASMTDEQFLEFSVGELKGYLPLDIDEATTMTDSYAEDGKLVYAYTIKTPPEELNFEELRGNIQETNFANWCADPTAEEFRKRGVQIILRYSNIDNAKLGDVSIDTGACPKE